MSYFADVPERIPFDGSGSKNRLAFKHYDADEIVEGKSMRDWLRFSVCYWHTFRATGVDPFGAATLMRGHGSMNTHSARTGILKT